MNKLKLYRLFGILLAALCIFAMPLASQAAPSKGKAKAAQQVQKERLVLMPLRLEGEDQKLQGTMESALVDGLQQKYTVLWGEEVEKKAQEIFRKENLKHECNEERCMQGIAEAFQSELLATVIITKQAGGYFLTLTIQNLYDHLVVFTRPLQCKGCDSFQVVDKLKELGIAAAPVVASSAPPAAEAPQATLTATDPDSIAWGDAQKGNTADDYQVYLDAYPKGKYIAFAKAKLKKLKEAEQAAAEQQEQQAWNTAQQENSEVSYTRYLTAYPSGRFAGFARTRGDKLKAALSYKAETDLWQKAEAGMDKAAVEAYLNRYPAGRYIAQASAKLHAIKEEEAKGPVMVKIPGKNYELGKYHVTKGEFAKFVSETGYDAGNSCYVWDGSKWDNRSGSNWRNPGFAQDDSHPATCVNWNDAQAYAAWLSKKTGKQYRLPIESEWEYACYGGSQTEYCGSNDINVVAWYKDNSNATTHPVGQKQANGYGLYDMSGNLWQWMENKYDDKNDWRALRGGSWSNYPRNVRAAFRLNYAPSARFNNYGFRLARTLP